MRGYLCVISVVILSFLLIYANITAAAKQRRAIENEQQLFSIFKYPYDDYYLTDDIILINEHPVMFNSPDNAFHGTLDGNGHSVYYFSVDSSADTFAFIGYSDGTVKNINFKYIRPTQRQRQLPVGGVVAHNNGTVSGCSFDIESEEDVNVSINEQIDIDDKQRTVSDKNTSSAYCHSETSMSVSSESVQIVDNSRDVSSVSSKSRTTESSMTVSRKSKIKGKESKESAVSSMCVDSSAVIEKEELYDDACENKTNNAAGFSILIVTAAVIVFSFLFTVFRDVNKNKQQISDDNVTDD